MTEIRYGQKIIESHNDDGTLSITTEGYFGGLSSIKEQIREDIPTSYTTLLEDVIKCLDKLKSGTPELVIRITTDRSGTPTVIQKTWLESKQKIK